MTFQKKEDMWMYSNEKAKGKETPKEFQKKEDIWIRLTNQHI